LHCSLCCRRHVDTRFRARHPARDQNPRATQLRWACPHSGAPTLPPPVFALQKLGLGPKDVSLIVVGGTSERIASLRLGKIQGTLFSPPQNITAQREGFNALADVAELGLPFVHIGVATTRTFIRDNPEIVRRYVKSHSEAIAAMKTDREMAIKTLTKYLGQI